MPESVLLRVLKKLVQVLNLLGIKYVVVGAIPNIVYGLPRVTYDIDIYIDIHNDQKAEKLIEELRAARIKSMCTKDDIVLGDYAYFVDEDSGVSIDLLMKDQLPFDDNFIKRMITVKIGKFKFYLPSREDYICVKLKLGRSKDIDDVIAVTCRNYSQLDWVYLLNRARKLTIEEQAKMLREKVKRELNSS